MTCFMIGKETLHQYCKKNGIKYMTMWKRIDGGYTPEEAIKTKVNRKNNLKYIINGRSARSQMDNKTYQRYIKTVKW